MHDSPSLTPFPPEADFKKSVQILETLGPARAKIGELKGAAASLPNPDILLDTLFLQEALASSEIENIVTTQDEAFRASADPQSPSGSLEAKEVARYSDAMRLGYSAWQQHRLISEAMLIEMFRLIKQRADTDGYRAIPGTVIRKGKEDIYTPPQPQDIARHMRQLAEFINKKERRYDPLVEMALIHHQFESIHPFPDGNGRVGRILNVLYLTHTGLLDAPILYMSRSINRTRPEYYRLLQIARKENAWEEWVVYMIRAAADSADSALHLVSDIRRLMEDCKRRMRGELPKVYSLELLNTLFRHPYTRIEYVAKALPVTWHTARKYLKTLAAAGFVEEVKSGRNNYYKNRQLVALLLEVSDKDAAKGAHL